MDEKRDGVADDRDDANRPSTTTDEKPDPAGPVSPPVPGNGERDGAETDNRRGGYGAG